MTRGKIKVAPAFLAQVALEQVAPADIEAEEPQQLLLDRTARYAQKRKQLVVAGHAKEQGVALAGPVDHILRRGRVVEAVLGTAVGFALPAVVPGPLPCKDQWRFLVGEPDPFDRHPGLV